MSSSRSIAAARQRRAGEAVPIARQQGPGQSIGNAAAFQQQQQQSRRAGQQQQMPQQQQQQQMPQQQQQQPAPQKAKISISDAIGLLSLRMGVAEQIIMDLQNEEGGNISNASLPENTQLVDKSVLTNMVSRIDSLEKREPNTSAISSSQLANLVNEMKEIKEMLMTHMFKYEKNINETDKRFLDVEDAFVQLEQNLMPIDLTDHVSFENIIIENITNENEEIQEGEREQIDQEGTQQEDVNIYSDKIASTNLKELIKQELSTNE